jgi:hypothetical protein
MSPAVDLAVGLSGSGLCRGRLPSAKPLLRFALPLLLRLDGLAAPWGQLFTLQSFCGGLHSAQEPLWTRP